MAVEGKGKKVAVGASVDVGKAATCSVGMAVVIWKAVRNPPLPRKTPIAITTTTIPTINPKAPNPAKIGQSGWGDGAGFEGAAIVLGRGGTGIATVGPPGAGRCAATAREKACAISST